jgi:hypothetical protein
LTETSPIADCLSHSAQGELISIQYFLRVFVKHDSWGAGGEGSCISIPIKIEQPYFMITTKEWVPVDKLFGPIITTN